MEFIEAETNTIDEALTESFTQALTKTGFKFPAKLINSETQPRASRLTKAILLLMPKMICSM